jgi:hypothetical protein
MLIFVGTYFYITSRAPFPNSNDFEVVCTHIYENDLWRDGSGHGSEPKSSKPYLKYYKTMLIPRT